LFQNKVLLRSSVTNKSFCFRFSPLMSVPSDQGDAQLVVSDDEVTSDLLTGTGFPSAKKQTALKEEIAVAPAAFKDVADPECGL
jgi:hypothetical protein